MTKIISSSIIIKELNLNIELNKILDELEQEVLQEIESDSKHELLKRHLERQLIKYLNKYLKKDFAIELVFVSIRKTLKNQEEITDTQYKDHTEGIGYKFDMFLILHKNITRGH